ncbi:hypothetical protein IAQ61_009299 [Plenodomus lingam]|uniref:uncharacterized protein n=1 Tax=Leptosphaeria maculans TaxID=5022 RepID=UPI00332F9E23|nr:hypothetical protein IAQ61_009299 [Plenodomus lingam]
MPLMLLYRTSQTLPWASTARFTHPCLLQKQSQTRLTMWINTAAPVLGRDQIARMGEDDSMALSKGEGGGIGGMR